MSLVGLGCAKTPAVAPHVEISPGNCIPESQIILHTRGSMPCWRIVFSTFCGCMSFYTGSVKTAARQCSRARMLKNETYTGVRYFNRITKATEANREGKKVIRGKWILRDRAEWIAVNVPAIVSRELFEKVQERLRTHDQRYCKPATHYLLSGLVQCGVCGARCSSSTGYHKVLRPSGKVSVYHQAVYRCNRKARENVHDRTQIERCRNSRMNTHILEGKVFEMI